MSTLQLLGGFAGPLFTSVVCVSCGGAHSATTAGTVATEAGTGDARTNMADFGEGSGSDASAGPEAEGADVVVATGETGLAAATAIEGDSGCILSGCKFGNSGFAFMYSCGSGEPSWVIQYQYDSQKGFQTGETADATFPNGHAVHCEFSRPPNATPIRLCSDDTGASCTWGGP